MIFSSLVFLCIFFPLVLLLHCILPSLRLKNGLLIVSSLLFYAYGEPVYVLLMLASSVLNYAAARLVAPGRNHRKAFLAAGVAANLGLLVFFKYAAFLVETCNVLFPLQLPVPRIPLPVGISFFTFQALSYVIDVYQEKADVQKSYPKVLLYISFFPQLVAGPIVKYRDISAAIDGRTVDAEGIARGMRRFICGLGKKVLIANTAGLAADHVFLAAHSEVDMAAAWVGAIAYTLQIYYDFSGYSDMAIGLGQMFGFRFRENFQYPYGAVSVRDFWRRWHISLSTWFREYLYIPLGGNRKGQVRTCVNLLIVFLCTGIWHGANWTFVVWGLWHGLFLLLERLLPETKIPSFITRIYTMLVVIAGWVVFRADTIGDGLFLLRRMFAGAWGAGISNLALQQLTPWFLAMAAAGIIGMAPIRGLVGRIQAHDSEETCVGGWKTVRAVTYVLSVFLLIWCMIRLSGSTYNPFIYFRF